MTITIDTGSLDEGGALMHAEDAPAQLCLALVRLEAKLAGCGLDLSDVDRLRVLLIERVAPGELIDLIAERLDATAATPTVTWACVERLEVPGMLVGISADVTGHRIHPDQKD
ncbi:hypothetical protein ACFPER_13710 [Agromyces aurantiacus]|uniref:Uncharacterized protein n=1 Tax=Agromyces aurantiacus TaxID=165814 RepID=A0ABV9R8K9_9MICO|nr:hypothetical protein [Agromyces aurantiacus]MBM7505251.1 enamine deaminase RidA (YjgF/YER057c/UK114 family) [Agromyces aurantiacus]